MSVAVELTDLASAIEQYGWGAYVLTTSDDGRPHATHVSIEADGGRLRAVVGRKTAANASARPGMSLLWPPHVAGGYSLIVDADAVADLSGDDPVLVMTPTRAVLHRPAPSKATEPGACVADCVPLNVAAPPS